MSPPRQVCPLSAFVFVHTFIRTLYAAQSAARTLLRYTRVTLRARTRVPILHFLDAAGGAGELHYTA